MVMVIFSMSSPRMVIGVSVRVVRVSAFSETVVVALAELVVKRAVKAIAAIKNTFFIVVLNLKCDYKLLLKKFVLKNVHVIIIRCRQIKNRFLGRRFGASKACDK